MPMTYAEIDQVYRHLWDLKDSFGPNANRRTRAVIMIGACIENGFDTKPLILKGLRVARLNAKHVQGLLDEQTGDVPGIHLWRRDEDGRYHVLDAA